jgi:hypothetical protein
MGPLDQAPTLIQAAEWCSEACADWTAHREVCLTGSERINYLDTLAQSERAFLTMGFDLDDWLQRVLPTLLTPGTLYSALDLRRSPRRARTEILLIEVVAATTRPLWDLASAFSVTRVKAVDATSLEMFYAAKPYVVPPCVGIVISSSHSAYGIGAYPAQAERDWQDVIADWARLAEADAGGDAVRDVDYHLVNAIVFCKSPDTFASLWTNAERWHARAVMGRIAQVDWVHDEDWLEELEAPRGESGPLLSSGQGP